MVTIQNLEVHLEVEGEGDEAVFIRLFEKHINRWSRLASEQKRRQQRAEEDRSIGDSSAREGKSC